jgi:bifunctional non-homologous end joining protein LigD
MSDQFVIQKHTKPGDAHWDLMVQEGDMLQTWRLDKSPKQLLNTQAKAEKIFDHPLKFLTYEGNVNEGKGSVKIADKGICKITAQSDSKIEMELAGAILKGEFILTHIIETSWQFGSKIIS